MAIDSKRLLSVFDGAVRLLGIAEILKLGGMPVGAQQQVKASVRQLVRQGVLVQEGKRYRRSEAILDRNSGPAFVSGPKSKAPAQRGGEKKSKVSEPNARSHSGRHKPATAQKASPPAKPSGNIVEGIIYHHRDGFAFVKPLAGKGEDYFVPKEQAARAIDHDRVRVEVLKGKDGRTQARLVDVVTRTRQFVIGTYHLSHGKAWVEPKETELRLIDVPPTQLAREGDIVKVALGVGTILLEGQGRLTGEVAGSLGSTADHSIEVLSVAYGKGFHDEFPAAVMEEADAIGLTVSAKEASAPGRVDLRSLQLVTIDGEDARDFDDAIAVEEVAGGFRLVVAIADVSHYVTVGSALDAEALRRATSVYLPGRVLPMLPERLSNGICSLKPNVDRLCMVADMTIDVHGTTLQSSIYPAVMRSQARCTYEEVHRVLSGENVPERNAFRGLFARALRLAETLRHMRRLRGSIDFDLPETKIELGEDGLPLRLVRRERLESHRLVEECMLAANEAVARFCRENELDTVNRFHGPPDDERLEKFLSLMRAYGFAPKSGKMSSKELNKLLESLDGHAEQRALHQLALRSMMQAVYSSERTGHFGLAATDYLHFTSPIRRYPDLLVHRQLKAFWAKAGKGKKKATTAPQAQLEEMALQSSDRERAAMLVEREVNSLYSCLLMKDRVGESFPGKVSGLTEAGFFVELDDLYVDGLVKGETVFPRFELDVKTFRLRFGDGREVRIGEACVVKLVGVSMERKQIDFVAESLEGEAVTARAPRNAAPARFAQRRGGAAEKHQHQHQRKQGSPKEQWQGRVASKAKGQEVSRSFARERPQPPTDKVATSSGGFNLDETLNRFRKERGAAPAKPFEKKAAAGSKKKRR